MIAAAARAVERTPAVVYDLDKVDRVIDAIRADLAPIPRCHLTFALKANRCPGVLAHLAARGLGADVASRAELRLATRAGFRAISATTPMLDAAFCRALAGAGVTIDLNGPSQLDQWLRFRPKESTNIGIRVRLPCAIEDCDDGGLSRFGFDADDPHLRDLVRDHGLHVAQLHFHAGELGPLDRAFGTISSCLDVAAAHFPAARTINLGGGFSRLYENRDDARRLFELVGERLRAHRGRPRIIFEPGMALMAASGYLVTNVVGADDHPSGRRTIAVDSSAWNLATWVPPQLVGVLPSTDQPRPRRVHDVVGATCYERDAFLRGAERARIDVGDRLILGGFGAYAMSMARRTHGLTPPAEWLLANRGLTRARGGHE